VANQTKEIAMTECTNEREWKLDHAASKRAHHRLTFREQLVQTRMDAASLAWERAKLASSMLHYAATTGQHRAARALASIKRRAVARAMSLMPGVIRVSVDENYHIGLLSIGWRGRGRLHLPADSQLPDTVRSVRPMAMTA
jgi:hypothetical protein